DFILCCFMVLINASMLTLRFRLLMTLIAFSGCVFAVEVTVKYNHLNATEGGNVTLQCTYTTTVDNLSELNIQWTFLGTTTKKPKQQTSCATGYNVDDNSVMLCPKTVHMFDRRGLCSWQHQIYFSEGKQIYINEEFKGRLVATHAPGNASITIEKLRPSDTGNYLCQVDNPPDFDGTNIRSIVLTVLASENDHIIGAIIGAILAAIVIGAIVWVIAKKTKKKAKKNMEKDTEFQVKQEPRKASTTYASVPTDDASAAATNATDAQLSEASEVHSHPNETPLLSENVVPSGTEKTPNEEIEGVGTHAV
ncbi:hypothetical protein chiPu_0007958, partial [Chiloscyllium punctatum]|nr:hypothetical protein [Chiloscyllium punctatum]